MNKQPITVHVACDCEEATRVLDAVQQRVEDLERRARALATATSPASVAGVALVGGAVAGSTRPISRRTLLGFWRRR